MNNFRQSGVALIQVLLISGLLLLLVVQLSKAAQNSVKIATQLKEKSTAEVRIHSQFENMQYSLMTERKSYRLSFLGPYELSFTGDTASIGKNMYVELQDQAGLLSTSFVSSEWLELEGISKKMLDRLKSWQGFEEFVSDSAENRNARLPYVKELTLLNGWQEVDLNNFTRFPTGFFNVATAPESLLRKVYAPEIVDNVLLARRSPSFDRNSIKSIKGLSDSSAFFPSNYLGVTFKLRMNSDNDRFLVRNKLFQLQLDKNIPILEIGEGAP